MGNITLTGEITMDINFNPHINKINNQTPKKNTSFRGEIKDEFVRTTPSTASTLEKEIKNAIDYCIESTKNGSNVENSYAITRDGKFLYKNTGKDCKCHIEHEKLEPHSIIYHSHPTDYLSPLSAGDIWQLVQHEDIDKVVAVDRQGRTSSLEKGPNFKQLLIKESTEDEIYEMMEQTWCDSLGIEAKYDEKFLKDVECKLKEAYEVESDEEFIKMFYKGKRPQRIKKAFKDHLVSALEYKRIPVETPARKAFLANIDKIGEIQHTPKGIETQKQFNQEIAERFGLIFEYNE